MSETTCGVSLADGSVPHIASLMRATDEGVEAHSPILMFASLITLAQRATSSAARPRRMIVMMSLPALTRAALAASIMAASGGVQAATIRRAEWAAHDGGY